MMQGVILTSGLQSWQIVQRRDGFGEIKIAGWYFVEGLPGDAPVEILARIVREDSGEPVIGWQSCRRDGVNWHAVISGIPAGGLYRLETVLRYPGENGLSVTRGDMAHHFGVGDLYVIAGQSNAVGRATDAVFDLPELGVHVLRPGGFWDLASHPLSETTGAFLTPHMENANPAHGPFLRFAKRLRAELGIPIGLIPTAKGGSGLWQWDPESEATLFHNMLRILGEYAPRVAGVLWYQGCADAFERQGADYLERFSRFVSACREALRQPELPFLTVQLNRCTMESSPEQDASWGMVRDAQRRAAEVIPGVSVVPATDLTLFDFIHNSAGANVLLGERCARTALGAVYGGEMPWRAPTPAHAKKLAGGRIQIWFDNVFDGLRVSETKPEDLPFTLEDEAGLQQPSACELERDAIVLTFARTPSPGARLHGLWQMNPPAPPVWDGERMPILSFYGLEIT